VTHAAPTPALEAVAEERVEYDEDTVWRPERESGGGVL
jgi:hypothetical protein